MLTYLDLLIEYFSAAEGSSQSPRLVERKLQVSILLYCIKHSIYKIFHFFVLILGHSANLLKTLTQQIFHLKIVAYPLRSRARVRSQRPTHHSTSHFL